MPERAIFAFTIEIFWVASFEIWQNHTMLDGKMEWLNKRPLEQ